MKANPRAAPAAILSLVVQSNGVLPGPLLPVKIHNKKCMRGSCVKKSHDAPFKYLSPTVDSK